MAFARSFASAGLSEGAEPLRHSDHETYSDFAIAATAAAMNGSTIVSIILAATLLVVIVVAVVSFVHCRRKRRRHRVFLAGNIVESGYSIHYGPEGKKGSTFHAKPFSVSPPPEDFVVVSEEEHFDEPSKRPDSPPTLLSLLSPPTTEASTVEEEPEPRHVFSLDVTGLVERHQEHHVQSFDETSLAIADFADVADERLGREYKSLNRSFFGDQSTDEANHVENIKKNRYFNVLPYDFNRVKLRQDVHGGSDYINASGIKVPGHHGIRYIATQGPIGADECAREGTVADFWRMVWEHSQCIVMLTDCFERGKIKCAIYWPENPGEEITVAGMTINFYCFTEDEICYRREFHVTCDGETRTILQWHLRGWNDTEAPNPEDLLQFVRAVRESRPCDPIVVHCSAGVGRSGVFIAVDILLERVEDPETPCINICGCVRYLRTQRAAMVRNAYQYEAIYRTLLLAIRQRNRYTAEICEEETSEVDI
ncbi:hypothetical protein QR680_009515 [Steinernema hermaphroditum]|uniref:Protein-tyrosine-phosphatase n=1 Tax=Steinernema hermaphroditum TaxID=289476 RepID=A0AA39IKK3_9BILA|nr:hypothetical protein QR680_009515 [Steinernema hermaphroditum]